MQTNLQIGLIGSYAGKPLDIILPIVSEAEFAVKRETPGFCFHIYSMSDTTISLFYNDKSGQRHTAKIDIGSSCKTNSNISIYVVQMNNGKFYLRSYIDEHHNGLYPIAI